MAIPYPIMIPTEESKFEYEKPKKFLRIAPLVHTNGSKFSWDFAVEDCYKKIREIGKGSNSSISSAIHEKYGLVIIKEFIDPLDCVDAEYESYLLKMCRNCVSNVYDTWVSRKGTFNIAMEKVECTLYEWLIYSEKKTTNKILIIKNLFKKVRDLHKKVVHFNLKPGNVEILLNFDCKLLDLSLSEKIESLQSEIFIQEHDIGNIEKMSHFYRPSEGFLPLDPLSEKSDIWSIGCILWDILTENPDEPLFSGIELDLNEEYEGLFYKDFILTTGIEYINTLKFERHNTSFEQKMYDTISKCIKHNQHERPTAQELVDDWADW